MADELSWVNVHGQVTKADFYGFLKALDVWIEKPHVVNRRLMGALVIAKTSFDRLTGKDLDGFFHDQEKFLLQGTCITTADCKDAESGGDMKSKEDGEKEHLSGPVENEEEQDLVILRRLLPRQLDRKDPIFELVILGKAFSSY